MNAQAQLDSFIDKFTPEVATLTRELLRKMKRRVPGATIMVYDNYNALAIGFGPTEKASQAVLSLAVMPRWVTLCFLYGVGLPDPHGILNGSGTQVRHVRLHTAEAFDDPRVQDLIDAALDRCEPPIDSTREHELIIKSISAKQRPRRPKD
ncbi:MAG TPA: hypothetical protein VF757_10805 [Sphingomicrobium sp.]